VTGSGRAVADAETGELSADLGAALVTLAGGAVIPVPPGETIDIPGIVTFFGSSSRIIEDDGLKVIEIETGRMESALLGNATFGRAAAGLELAATSGGSFGGGGGCSVAPGGEAGDAKLVVGLLVLLGSAAFRRRRR
jgi:MYXO-CTERM domain-containing protein